MKLPKGRASRWWLLLAVLVFGVPQSSWVITKAMGLIPYGSVVNGPYEFIITYVLFGASTAVTLGSSIAILAFIMLLGGDRWRRVVAAIGFILCSVFVNLGVLYFIEPIWFRFVMMNDTDLLSLLGYLLLPISMSMTSLAAAAVMQFFRGWSMLCKDAPRQTRPIDLTTLLEWVFISAVLFASLRVTFVLRYQSNYDVMFYELVMVLLPSTGIAVATMCLFRWLLGTSVDAPIRETSLKRRVGTRMVIVIILVHGVVYATAVRSLQWHDPSIAIGLHLQSAIASLTTCLVGTVNVAAIVYCFRKLGYRLAAYWDAASDPLSV
ncbi:MAG: hypothetical protein KDB00_07375 [Planctomycetales bacterium]|nr:hypothetical protein [Planctomycetales bacterium]